MLAQQTVISIDFKIQYSQQLFEIQGQWVKKLYKLLNFFLLHLKPIAVVA